MNGFASLLDFVKQHAINFPADIAYQFVTSHGNYETLTYAELDQRARAVAAVLRQDKCQGERAVLLLPPSLDYLLAFFGCLYAGVIAVPAYPPSRNRHSQRLLNIIKDSGAQFIITQHVFASQFAATSSGNNKAKVVSIDLIEKEIVTNEILARPQAEDIAFLQYTSGSTSHPKGVMVSFGNIAANLEILKNHFGSDCSVTCSWLPPYHDMGLVAGIILPLYLKSKAILMAPSYFLQSPLRWLEIISQEKVRLSGAPNFAYDLCVNKIQPGQIKNLDLSSWKYAVNGAEIIRATTMQRFINAFSAAGFSASSMYPCYGLAEATLMLTGRRAEKSLALSKSNLQRGKIVLASADEPAVRLVSCGTMQKNHRIRIVDAKTAAALPEESLGEIWASGPSITKGYFNKPEITQEFFHARVAHDPSDTHNYLRTGDLGFIHQNELYIAGRMKDVIILKGLNYYPEDLELTVSTSHSAFQAHGAAAFSVEIDNEERLVVLQEVMRDQVNKIEVNEALKAIDTALLREYGLDAHSIVLLKPHSLPKTTSGKIQRWSCRSEFLENSLQTLAVWQKDPHPSGYLCKKEESTPQIDRYEEIKNWLVDWFGQQLRIEDRRILLEKNLVDLEFSSLMAAELSSELYNRLGKRFEMTALLEQETLEKLAEFIASDAVVVHQEKHSFSETSGELIKPLDASLLETVKNIYFKINNGISTNNTVIEGREYINFSGYNYLGMSGDEQVTTAVIAAIKEYGTSVSASRLVSGEKQLHIQLERAVCNLIGTEDAAVLSSGYATNVAIITHLFGPGDLVIYDALSHNSILQGAHFSGATCLAFPHNDCALLEELLEKKRDQYRRVLIVSEGVFSMDGDIPDVKKLVAIKKKFQCFLMLDEAHSMGVIGKTGCGIREYYNINPGDVDIWMGTLSKAFASCGGYISGTAELIEHFKYSSAGFVYSAGISPANTAAALAAVELMQHQPSRVRNLQKRHSLLLSLLNNAGIPTGKSFDTPIIPIMAGSTEKAIAISNYLKTHAINALPIFYPAVEKQLARVRLFINSLHTEEQINYTADTIISGYQCL